MIDKIKRIELGNRKKRIEKKLISLGIKDTKITYLPYLDYQKEDFQNPYEVGCRLLILQAIAYSVSNLNDRTEIIDWLKYEQIWDKVSEREVDFFTNLSPEDDELADLSWRIESALVLAWVLNLIDNLPEIDQEDTDEVMEIFITKVPEVGGEIKRFLGSLTFRNFDEVFEENILNELATTYFRDLRFNGKKDETKINRTISFERHNTLNWVRRFSGISEWDETDTST